MAYNRKTRFAEIEEEQHEILERLITMLDDALLVCDIKDGVPNTRQLAEHLVSCGVVVNDKKRRERKKR